jgi:hypothetical protein
MLPHLIEKLIEFPRPLQLVAPHVLIVEEFEYHIAKRFKAVYF